MTQGEAVWGWMAKQCDAVCRRAQRCEAGPFDAAGRWSVTKDYVVCRESDDNNAVCMQCDITRTSAERHRRRGRRKAHSFRLCVTCGYCVTKGDVRRRAMQCIMEGDQCDGGRVSVTNRVMQCGGSRCSVTLRNAGPGSVVPGAGRCSVKKSYV